MTDIKKLTKAWIDYQNSQDEELEWASDDFIDLANESPEIAWECVLELIDTETSDEVLAILAEGPLEDLLAEHGSHFIDRIEGMSKDNLVFSRLIKHVWVDGIPAQIQDRIRTIQNNHGGQA